MLTDADNPMHAVYNADKRNDLPEIVLMSFIILLYPKSTPFQDFTLIINTNKGALLDL